MKILVTGSAGFIGYHFSKKILKLKNITVIGIDDLNDYYDVSLKKNRIKELKKHKNFNFLKKNINSNYISEIFKKNKFDVVVHLAAQAGVRDSITNPKKYFESNIKGFFNILEQCKKNKTKHLIFASSSSVYGNSNKFPIKEEYDTSSPLSFYAASKKTNEVMAFSYSNIYKLPVTGLRFFTVYGPSGRPDMSLFKFANRIKNRKKIEVYNFGNHERDFTYIDDVTECIYKLLLKPASNKKIPYQVFNICSNNPNKLKQFISLIEKNLSLKSKKKYIGMQVGDVKKTNGDNSKINKYIKKYKYKNINEGIYNFINWFKKNNDRKK